MRTKPLSAILMVKNVNLLRYAISQKHKTFKSKNFSFFFTRLKESTLKSEHICPDYVTISELNAMVCKLILVIHMALHASANMLKAIEWCFGKCVYLLSAES